MEFVPLTNAQPAPGLAISVEHGAGWFWRITHVFENCLYVMRVTTAEDVTRAKRPIKQTNAEFSSLITHDGATLGQLKLPPSMSTLPEAGSTVAQTIEAEWTLLRPLVERLSAQESLGHYQYSASIRLEAQTKAVDFAVLRRLLLRYYYFGSTKLALLKLPPGRKPGHRPYAIDGDAPSVGPGARRRGRKTKLATELGPNEFIISDEDISDIVSTYKSLLRKGPTTRSHAHEKYLASAFRRRHPQVYIEYQTGQRVEPITGRQFTYYLQRHAKISEDIVGNVRNYQRNQGRVGALYARGPGEVYEIDSTGGRIFLVSEGKNPILVGKPTIYLLVDRWSRFVVSAYMSLKAPSYEEVRHALLIAFTSRERRFQALGIDIDDKRWPMGHMPAVICPDRGSEFMSEPMEHSVVEELRIELTPLPPYCPDGKAIVERLIREVKRRMSGTGMKGTFADRPMDPETKRAASGAKTAAVHTLSEAYRSLIEIIQDHNNRPHTALRRMRVLTQAGVPPTPKDAYMWGLENINGLRKGTLSDEDCQRLLLATDTASLASGTVRYRGRPYRPLNEIAVEISRTSTKRSKQVSVRVDKTDPYEVFMVTSQGLWGRFGITEGGANEIAGITLDEEESLATHTALLWARSEHQSRVDRVRTLGAKSKSPAKRTVTVEPATVKALHTARTEETNKVKRALTNNIEPRPPRPAGDKTGHMAEWEKIEEQDRLNRLAAVKRHKRKR
jgi:putative transposase